MRVLVTGSSGFLGSHLVGALQARGDTVIGIDRIPSWRGGPRPDHFVHANLQQPDQLGRALQGCTQVYDLACDLGGVAYLEANQSAMYANNIRANLAALEAATAAGARYLFTSSACVYPERKPPLGGWHEADAWTAPPSEGTYGVAKLAHEAACAGFREQGAAVRVARLSNTYGELGDWDGLRAKSPAALCRKVAEAVRDGRDSIEVWGDGRQERDYLYVSDTVRGLLLLMDSDVTEPVNFGAAWASTDALAYAIVGSAGATLALQHVAGPEGVRARYVNSRRARTSLGWQPVVPISDGLARLYRWVEAQVAARAGVYA